MGKRTIHTSLEEDLKGLGIPGISMVEQARLGGIPMTEDADEPAEVEEESTDEGDEETPDSTNEDVDPLDAEEVNEDLFNAIMDLPFEGLQAEDVEEVLEALKGKKMPEDASDELKERAEEVVDHLIAEVAAKVTRRFKAGSVAKKKSKQCPQGFRKDGTKCVPAVKAAGGAGKLAKEGRKKKKWARSGAGKKSERKSARVAARRGEEMEFTESPFAAELLGLMEDNQEITETVRDELIDRMDRIFDLLSEEFEDEAVTRVFTEAFEPVSASWKAGRLDEDVMDDDEFIAEIKPVLTLIHKSLDRIGSEEALGN